VLRKAAKRLAVGYAALLAVTVGLSALLGVLAGANVERAIAVGLYLAAALVLTGCFVVGVRGPLRGVSKSGETVSVVGARSVRRATANERNEASAIAFALFVLGLSFVVLGALVDPAHRTF
jgi:hypothetical protein